MEKLNIEASMLGDLFEVARRVGRLGIPGVEINPAKRAVYFYDHRIRAWVELEIVQEGSDHYWWYTNINLPNGFDMGPLGKGRWILISPWPREVVRAYQHRIRWEMRPVRRKKCR